MKSEKELAAEAYILQLDELEEQIKLCREEYREAFEAASDITSCARDGVSGGNGTVSRKIENGAVRLASLALEIDELTERYELLRREIAGKLKALPRKERAVLHRIFILKMTNEATAEAVGMSAVNVWRIKKKGLENFAEKFLKM